jgi:hypothetical protein
MHLAQQIVNLVTGIALTVAVLLLAWSTISITLRRRDK